MTIYRPAPGDHANPLWALWRYADAQAQADQRGVGALGARTALGASSASRCWAPCARWAGPVPDEDDVQPFQLGPIPRAPLHDDPDDLRRYGRDRFKSKRARATPSSGTGSAGSGFELVEDVADRDGRLYTPGPMPGQQEVVGGGNNKDATLCGAFPHALVRHKIGRLKDKALFVCASTHAVVLTVRLRRKGVKADGPSPSAICSTTCTARSPTRSCGMRTASLKTRSSSTRSCSFTARTRTHRARIDPTRPSRRAARGQAAEPAKLGALRGRLPGGAHGQRRRGDAV